MSERTKLDEELMEVVRGQFKEFISKSEMTDYECLLVLKNLASEQENKINIQTQGAALYAALFNIGK